MFNLSLKKALIAIAEIALPNFSGQSKVLEILIKMYYHGGTFQYVKVVFWHPNNAMLVGYDFETHAEDISNEFTVTSNHSSTWKHDGLDFFSQIVKDPQSIEIVYSKIVEVQKAYLNEHEDFVYYK